ncbi:hypothetical protein [Aquimarina celericrescens]|uniref:SAP domain-containing protein n=1 Tax=Aquimarina celericrescens TaxID=1964542 RepID=A0ABW5AVG0_9FLAO|nr:hypothetical protein [Aquimarina celericrescens]
MEYMDILYRIFHDDLRPGVSQIPREELYSFLIKNKVQLKARHYLELKKYFIGDFDLEELSYQHLKFYYYDILIQLICKSIQKELYTDFFENNRNVKDFKKTVHDLQMLINGHLKTIEQHYFYDEDRISVFQISDKKKTQDIYKIIYTNLSYVLDFIENHYPSYMDKDLEISYTQQLWFIASHQKKVRELVKKLRAINLPDQINEELVRFLNKTIQDKRSFLTYNNRQYYSIFINALYELLNTEPKPSIEKLVEFFIRYDFYTFKIYFGVIEEIKSQLEEEVNLNIYQKQLYEYHRKYKSIIIETEVRFNPKLPHLKTSIMDYLVNEIELTKKMAELESKDDNNTQKFKLNMTVEEISLFTKLCYEAGITHGKKKDLIEFVSRSYYNESTKNISVKNLDNRYYNVSDITKERMRGYLQHMLNDLGRME